MSNAERGSLKKEVLMENEEYENLPVYRANKTSCDNCDRPFIQGEIISVDKTANFVFCYSDFEGGCVPGYIFFSKKILHCEHMKFGVGELPTEKRTPNYPYSPICVKKHISQKKPWWKKIFPFFPVMIFLFTACATNKINEKKETRKSVEEKIEIHLCGSKLVPRAWGNAEIYLRNGYIDKINLTILSLESNSDYTIQLIHPEQGLILYTNFYTKNSGSYNRENTHTYAQQSIYISSPKLITAKIYTGKNKAETKDSELAMFSSQSICDR